MIKTITLTIFSAILTTLAVGQTCTPDQSFIGQPPGIYPATPLTPSCDLVAPKTVVTLTDTTIFVAALNSDVILYFDAMRVNSVEGLPAGLTFETDVMGSATAQSPFGLWFNTGSIPSQTPALGCAFIYGTGGDWDALLNGGPNNDGVYPLVFHTDARIAQSVPDISFVVANGSWISTVPASSGGGELLLPFDMIVLAGYDTISAVIVGDAGVAPSIDYIYSVGQNPDVTYLWTITNGTIISGQGTNEVNVQWNANIDPTGNIQVEMTDGGCYGVSDVDVIIITVGISDATDLEFSIYPNPSSGLFNLNIESNDVTVQVLDLAGREVASFNNTNGNEMVIDLSSHPSGVYILKLISEEGTGLRRIIKK